MKSIKPSYDASNSKKTMQRVVAFSSITHTASDGTQVMLKALSYSKYKTTLYNEMREGYMGDAVEPSRELQESPRAFLF